MLNELRHKMADAVNQANDLLTREREVAEKEGRDVSPDVLAKVDELTGQAEEYRGQITEAEAKIKATEERSSRLESLRNELAAPAVARPNPIVVDGAAERNNPYASKQYRDAFFRYAQDGIYRDMLLSVPNNAGLLVAPVAVSDEIIKVAAATNPLHNLVTKKTVTGAVAYRVRRLTSFGNAPTFHAETDCINADDYTYDNIDLTPKIMPKLIKVSMAALAVSSDFESEVTSNLGRDYGDAEEAGELVGLGTGNNMLGAFVASANGIPTSRDIETTTAGTITYDDIMNMTWSLRTGYLNSKSVGWVFSRAVGAVVSKIKDLDGRPIWQPSLAQGVPPTLAGIPVYISEYAPTAITGGSYVAVLGDWSRYYTVEYPGGFTIQRLVERYAECSEVGFIARRYFTGAPVDAVAFSRLKVKSA